MHKGDDETEAGNYRPISLLSVYNRVFENLINIRLSSFIYKHDILYKSQYGFRKNHSTQVSTIQNNMGQKRYSCGIFLDLKKHLILSKS